MNLKNAVLFYHCTKTYLGILVFCQDFFSRVSCPTITLSTWPQCRLYKSEAERRTFTFCALGLGHLCLAGIRIEPFSRAVKEHCHSRTKSKEDILYE